MKRADVALFKRFLHREGIEKIFLGLYRSQNEEKIENYLGQTTVDRVILDAFTIEKEDESSPFLTRQFWELKQIDWEEETVKADINGWYRKDNTEIDKWLRIPYNSIVERISSKVEKERKKKENAEQSERQREALSQPEVTRPNSFKFFDIGGRSASSSTIKENELVVNSRAGSSRVSFSKYHSREIIASGLKYMGIGRDEYTGQVRIVFNDEQGVPYPQSCAKEGSVVVNSTKLVKLLKELFEVENDYFVLHISQNLANSEKYLTYNIRK